MSWKLLILGLVFLFNPIISVFDILPDFIACILVSCSLTKLAFLSPELESAAQSFNKLIYLSIGKSVAAIGVAVLSGSDSAVSLPLSFGFNIATAIMFIIAFNSLFSGMEYLETRYSTDIELAKKRTNARIMTYVFFIISTVLNLLPELSALNTDDDSLISGKVWVFSLYKNYFTAANIIISGIVGLTWLVICIRYFNSIRVNKSFNEELNTAFAEADPGETFWFKRGMKLAYGFLLAAAIININVYADGTTLLPDFISAIILFAAFRLFINYKCIKGKLPLYVSVAYFLLSCASWFISVIFASDYYISGEFVLQMIPKANSMYIMTIILQSISSILFVYLMLNVLYASYVNVSGYLKERYKNELQSSYDKQRKVRQKLYAKINICVLFVTLSAISKVLYYVFLFSFTEFWMVDVGLGIINAVLLGSLYSDLKYEIELS